MALGVVLFSLQRGYQQDLFGYLFGNVLAISCGDLILLGVLGAVVLAGLALAFRPLFAAFDEEVARAYGHPVDGLNAALLLLLAATVVIGVRLVGVILVEAPLVIPAATAALWAGHYRGQLALSMALGAGAGVAGHPRVPFRPRRRGRDRARRGGRLRLPGARPGPAPWSSGGTLC